MQKTAAILSIVLFVALSACSSSEDRLSSMLVSPEGEQYQFYNCDQIVGQLRGAVGTERNLEKSMEKGGAVASVLGGYQSDYAVQHGNYVALRAAARKKNCEIPADVAEERPAPSQKPK